MKVYYNKTNYIDFYLFFNLILVVFFLNIKNQIPGDFSISELFINYNGGFTRRGLLGHFFYILHDHFNINLRLIILIFQIVFHASFLLILFKIFRKLKKDLVILDYFLIFSPLFIFYPLSEFEALGIKRDVSIYIFCIFSFK